MVGRADVSIRSLTTFACYSTSLGGLVLLGKPGGLVLLDRPGELVLLGKVGGPVRLGELNPSVSD
ncbi:hypothetical protein CXX93_17990 [Gordonia sp. YC-JH1]|nr:hypothetical protein CXX93_17990 [Gordonia sp. YC-JH1]